MKPETIIIVMKGLTVTGVTLLSTLASGLSQWVGSNESPGRLAITVIVCGSLAAGLSSLSGFLSTSFGKYLNEMNGKNGTLPTAPIQKPPTP